MSFKIKTDHSPEELERLITYPRVYVTYEYFKSLPEYSLSAPTLAEFTKVKTWKYRTPYDAPEEEATWFIMHFDRSKGENGETKAYWMGRKGLDDLWGRMVSAWKGFYFEHRPSTSWPVIPFSNPKNKEVYAMQELIKLFTRRARRRLGANPNRAELDNYTLSLFSRTLAQYSDSGKHRHKPLRLSNFLKSIVS